MVMLFVCFLFGETICYATIWRNHTVLWYGTQALLKFKDNKSELVTQCSF